MKQKIQNSKKALIKNTKIIIFFFIGCSIGLIIMSFFIPDRISQLANGEEPVVSIDGLTITADELYSGLKEYGTTTLLLDIIDSFILDKKYDTTDELKKEVDETVNYYLDMANSYYGYSESEFLTKNGFSSLDDFKKTILIDYKRNMYFIDYMKKDVKDSDIENSYSTISGPINGKYIISDDAQIITDMIEKLDNGSTYNDLIITYGDNVIYDDFENMDFDTNIDNNIYNELITLKNYSYSSSYITVTDGYALVIKDDTNNKDPLENLKDRLKTYIAKNYANEDDGTLYNKAFETLRKEYNITFYDTIVKEEYKKYLTNY